MKLLLLAIALMPAAVRATPYEVCTLEGPCAIRAYDAANQTDVWLADSVGIDLSTVWGGTWHQVESDLYQKLSAEIPDGKRWHVPAVNPTSGEEMRKGAPPPKAPTPPSGPLIQVGDVTIGGGNPCAPCHGTDLKEIHKKAADRK